MVWLFQFSFNATFLIQLFVLPILNSNCVYVVGLYVINVFVNSREPFWCITTKECTLGEILSQEINEF